MNRALALAGVMFWFGVLAPTDVPAQNLEAGKSPGQIFSNTCSACHRSPRGLLRTVAPGSLPGFLREHYTTSRDMAQQLSGFLIANGATDTRGKPQEVRQQQPGRGEPQQADRAPRQEQQADRPPRQIEQQAARPPETQAAPDPDARLSRRERRAKARAAAMNPANEAPPPVATREERNQRNRRSRITPARIEAASERGKDALPLGSVVTVEPTEAAKPANALPDSTRRDTEPVKPEAAIPPPANPMTRNDPVPQVTPAPPAPAEAPASEPPASAETPHAADDTPSGSTTVEAPPEPAEQPRDGPSPTPPISQ